MIAKFKKTNPWPVLAVVLFASLGLITLTSAQNQTEAKAVSGGGSTAQSTSADKVAGAGTNSTEPTSALKTVVEGGTATALPAEPIVGPVFADNFDGGASKHWQWHDYSGEGLPPEHAVKNGELVLAHASAAINIDWTNYVVKVRVCVKEWAADGTKDCSIRARMTPSKGVSNWDWYQLSISFINNAPESLFLGMGYWDASKKLHVDPVGASSCNVVRDKWCWLEFEVKGQHLRGSVDGELLIDATDARLAKGGLMLKAHRARAHFDDFSVRQLP